MDHAFARKLYSTHELNCNVAIRWQKQNNFIHNSESTEYFYKKAIQNSYNRKVLVNASMHTRKNSKAIYITSLTPSLNNQLKYNKFLPFRIVLLTKKLIQSSSCSEKKNAKKKEINEDLKK